MNQKIYDRKAAAIAQILDQDGGCTLIEVLGLLELIKMNMYKLATSGALKVEGAKTEYKDLKARRVAGMGG